MPIRTTWSLLAILGLGAASAYAQDPLRVTVRELRASSGTIVFVATPARSGASSASLAEQTPRGLLAFALSYPELELGEDRNLRFYNLSVGPAAGGAIAHYKIRGECTGYIPDGWDNLVFDVHRGTQLVDTGSIRVPVACGGRLEDALALEDADKLQAIPLRGDAQFSIRLKNTIGVPLSIELPGSLAADDVWQTPPHPALAAPVTIMPGETKSVAFVASPKPFLASKASFFRVKSDQEHVQVPVVLPYQNPRIRNRNGSVDSVMRLRFEPRPEHLIGMLLAGVLIGSVVRPFAPRQRAKGTRRWAIGSLAAALVAFCIWLIGLFLVAFDSEFVVFSFELDPWQTLPTLLLGIFCGLLGDRSAPRLFKLLGLDDDSKET
jgi:hypothetical protein